MNQHLLMVPILLPLACGALLMPIDERRRRLKFAISLCSVLGMLVASMLLLQQADSGQWRHGIGVYLAGDWPAPFGITLVVDRLAAMMLILTALLSAAAILYAFPAWGRVGVHFHALFQFLLMGINGAFLTHDLFNLFVFFEIMLTASYGLLLHGHGAQRVRAGMQYIAVNLAASLLFLVGVATIYGVSGTLNMAELSARIASVGGGESALLRTGIVVLAIAFLVKSAAWPLGFWLPGTYAAASPPVAAMLVLMTKVGIYAILRLWLLVFPQAAGDVAGFGYHALLWGGLATIIFGAAGMLASDEPRRLAGYAAMVSSGTLLAAIGCGQASLVPAALYYMLSSTVAVATFMLLAELIDRIRSPRAALLAITSEAFAAEDLPQETAGVRVPAALAVLGLAFAACGLLIAGLPPLSGFVAKFSLLHSLLRMDTSHSPSASGWILAGALLLSGIAAIIAMMRTGVRIFWASGSVAAPRLSVVEVAPVAVLLSACVALTILAGPILDFLARTSDGLHRPHAYQERVLQAPRVAGRDG